MRGHQIDRRMGKIMVAPVIGTDAFIDELNPCRQGRSVSNRNDTIHLRNQLTGFIQIRSHRRAETVFVLQHLEGGISMQCESLQSSGHLQLLPIGIHPFPCRIAGESGVKILGVEIPEICCRTERHGPAIIKLMTDGQ